MGYGSRCFHLCTQMMCSPTQTKEKGRNLGLAELFAP